MNKKFHVRLSKKERDYLNSLTSKGKISVRKYKRCMILLLSDEASEEGCKQRNEICEILGVSQNLPFRICKQYIEEGLKAAIGDKPKSGRPRKLSGKEEAKVVALACTDAPEGYDRWTMRLLADNQVVLGIDEPVSHMTINRILKK